MKHWDTRQAKVNRALKSRLTLYERAKEAIEYLMEHEGHTTLSKREFAETMAIKYGRGWTRYNDEPNRELVAEVMNLTRDQDQDPTARELLGGFIVAYSPSVGGMTLIDPSGDIPLGHQLHMLAGDLQRQQATKTVNRRRISCWRAAAECAMRQSDFELGRLLSQMENEIDRTGFTSDSLVAEYMRALSKRGLAEAS